MLIERKRGAAKATAWGATAAATTLSMSLFATGHFSFWEVFAADTLLRTLLYYTHERLWSRTRYGLRPVRVFINSQTNSTWDYFDR